MPINEKLQKSYFFFIDKESKEISFKIDDLLNFTGWSRSTLNTYLSKKWAPFLTKKGDEYFVLGIKQYTEPEYLRLMSQVQKNYIDPTKPRLELDVEVLVIKSRECAILALDIYNRPGTLFKSEGFIVMIIIAWTSLLHAIFQQNGIDYFYKDENGEYKTIDNDFKAWELCTCIKNYYRNENNAITKNLEFLIGLRNKIVHRYVPTIDMHIAGECQAALLNFDELITAEFGEYYALKEYMSMPLQTSNIRTEQQIEIQKKFQGKQYDAVMTYIDAFREQVSDEIYQSPKYSFRVYLVPKIGNNLKSSDIALEFIKYDSQNPEIVNLINKQIAITREKKIQVVNPGKFKAGEIAKEVQIRIGRKFNASFHHAQACKFYKIRPLEKKGDGCNLEYCQFDEPHKDFVYTQAWIDFLAEKLSNNNEYSKLFSKKI